MPLYDTKQDVLADCARSRAVQLEHEPILTKRQCECLQWVRQGKSSTDIGAILGISGRVVDEHIANACERLGVRTRVQAVVVANARGCMDALDSQDIGLSGTGETTVAARTPTVGAHSFHILKE